MTIPSVTIDNWLLTIEIGTWQVADASQTPSYTTSKSLSLQPKWSKKHSLPKWLWSCKRPLRGRECGEVRCWLSGTKTISNPMGFWSLLRDVNWKNFAELLVSMTSILWRTKLSLKICCLSLQWHGMSDIKPEKCMSVGVYLFIGACLIIYIH